MTKRARLELAVYGAIDELNKQLPKGSQVEKAPDAQLYSTEGKLESLAFLTFIMEVESRIQDEFGIELLLTDDNLLSKQKSPFATLGTLIEYLEQLVSDDDTQV